MTATFLGMARDLMADTDARAAFAENPDGFLAARGFDGLSPEDLADAVGFVAETLPVETALALTEPAADGDVLTRLAQVEPPAAGEPALPGEGVDSASEEADGPDVDVDVDVAAAVDPALLPDAGDPIDEAFTGDEHDTGLGVGFGSEDVDDVSPPDHGEPPDLDLHL